MEHTHRWLIIYESHIGDKPRKHQIDLVEHEIQEDNILWLCSGPGVQHDWKRDFRLWV